MSGPTPTPGPGIPDTLHAALVGGYRPRVQLVDAFGRPAGPVVVVSADPGGVVVRIQRTGGTVRVDRYDRERGLAVLR